MKLIAVQMLRGGGVVADPGDEFECSDALGRAWVAAGVAREIPAPVKPRPRPEPEVESAEEQPAATVEKAVDQRTAKPRPKASRRKAASKKVSGKK